MVYLYWSRQYVWIGKWLVFYLCKEKESLWFCSEKDGYLEVAVAAVSQTSRSYLQLFFLKTLPSSRDDLAAQATSTMVFQRSKILLQRCLGCFAPNPGLIICSVCSGNQKCCAHSYILNAGIWLKDSGMMLFEENRNRKWGCDILPEIALLGGFSNKKLYSAFILKAKLLLNLATHLTPLNESCMTEGKATHLKNPTLQHLWTI